MLEQNQPYDVQDHGGDVPTMIGVALGIGCLVLVAVWCLS